MVRDFACRLQQGFAAAGIGSCVARRVFVLAIGAGLVALIIAVATGRLPRWLRVTVVLGLVILAAGAGFYAYRYYNYPRTLTVAAGSIDGVAPQLMSAISARLTATGLPCGCKSSIRGPR